MTLLERAIGPLLVAGVREEIIYIDPVNLDLTDRLETTHVAHLHQIVGLSKFSNEVFVSQDRYAAIKVFETETKSCFVSIESGGFQLNTHVTNTLIELINPYEELFQSRFNLKSEAEAELCLDEPSRQSEMEEEDQALIAVSIPFKTGCAIAVYSITLQDKSYSLIKVLNK